LAVIATVPGADRPGRRRGRCWFLDAELRSNASVELQRVPDLQAEGHTVLVGVRGEHTVRSLYSSKTAIVGVKVIGAGRDGSSSWAPAPGAEIASGICASAGAGAKPRTTAVTHVAGRRSRNTFWSLPHGTSVGHVAIKSTRGARTVPDQKRKLQKLCDSWIRDARMRQPWHFKPLARRPGDADGLLAAAASPRDFQNFRPLTTVISPWHLQCNPSTFEGRPLPIKAHPSWGGVAKPRVKQDAWRPSYRRRAHSRPPGTWWSSVMRRPRVFERARRSPLAPVVSRSRGCPRRSPPGGIAGWSRDPGRVLDRPHREYRRKPFDGSGVLSHLLRNR